VIIFGSAACLAAVVAGLLLDPRAFAVNLLASGVAILVSVAVAVRLIDPILRARRRRDWRLVSNATLVAIRTHVIDCVVQCWIQLGGSNGELLDLLLEGRDKFAMRALSGMERLLVLLEGLDPDTETQSLYDDVKWDLGQVRDVLTPRVMLTAEDESLVGRLVTLEDAERVWVNYLIGDHQSAIGGTLRGVIAVVAASRDLYLALLDHVGDEVPVLGLSG
jgi:hypothetical protein